MLCVLMGAHHGCSACCASSPHVTTQLLPSLRVLDMRGNPSFTDGFLIKHTATAPAPLLLTERRLEDTFITNGGVACFAEAWLGKRERDEVGVEAQQRQERAGAWGSVDGHASHAHIIGRAQGLAYTPNDDSCAFSCKARDLFAQCLGRPRHGRLG